jgi:hypothetical protein
MTLYLISPGHEFGMSSSRLAILVVHQSPRGSDALRSRNQSGPTDWSGRLAGAVDSFRWWYANILAKCLFVEDLVRVEGGEEFSHLIKFSWIELNALSENMDEQFLDSFRPWPESRRV